MIHFKTVPSTLMVVLLSYLSPWFSRSNGYGLLGYAVLLDIKVKLKNVHKNIERHTAHTIVSWSNPKQRVLVHTSDLMMMIGQSIYVLSIITREMGKLKTHSPTYCIMNSCENMHDIPWYSMSTVMLCLSVYSYRTFTHIYSWLLRCTLNGTA